jgi:hypothetical protein
MITFLRRPPLRNRLLTPADEPRIITPERKLHLPRFISDPRLWKKVWDDKPGMSSSCCNCNCSTYGCALPCQLHVTFSNSGACARLDGKTFLLTIAVTGTTCQWFSATQTDACGTYSMNLTCGPGVHAACPATDMVFNPNWSATNSTNNCLVAGSSTCSPISLVFNLNTPNVAGTAACCAPATAITATVTL